MMRGKKRARTWNERRKLKTGNSRRKEKTEHNNLWKKIHKRQKEKLGIPVELQIQLLLIRGP